MLNKKGIGNEVDWIIAMGLFLVYLTAIFVIFQPGIRPVFEVESLLNIVQREFMNATTWEVSKIPIFLSGIQFKQNACVPDPSHNVFCKTSDIQNSYYVRLNGEFHAPPSTSDAGNSFIGKLYPSMDQNEIEKHITFFYIPPRSGNSITGYDIAAITGYDTKSCTSDSDCENTDIRHPSVCSPRTPQTTSPTTGDRTQEERTCKQLQNIPCTTNSDCARPSPYPFSSPWTEWTCVTGKACVPPITQVTNPQDTPPSTRPNTQPDIPKTCTVRLNDCPDGKSCIASPSDPASGTCQKNNGAPAPSSPDQQQRTTVQQRLYSQGRTQALAESNLPFKLTSVKQPVFKINQITSQRQFLLIYSQDIINPDGGQFPLSDANLFLNGDLTPNAQNVYTACLLPGYDTTKPITAGDCKLQYSLGGTETERGAALTKVIDLNQYVPAEQNAAQCIKGYDCLKKKWGFPDIKDFQITIQDTSNTLFPPTQFPDGVLKFPTDKSIPLEARVKVRQFNAYALSPDGLKIPITVTIKVW